MPAGDKARSLTSKALETFGARLIVSALSIAAGVLVARALGPTGKGAYSAVQTLVSVPVAVTGGVGSAITFFIAHERWSVRDLLPALAAIFAGSTLLCVVGAVIYAALAGWTPASIAFAAAVPACVVLSWQQGFYIGIDRLRTMNAQVILQAAATLAVLAMLCLWLRVGTAGALIAWVVCSYAAALFVTVQAFREGGALHGRDFGMRIKRVIGFGSQTSLNGVLGLLNYRVDSLILIALLGLAPFGIYSIAVNLGEMLFLLLRPVNMAVGRDIGASTPERSARLTADTVRLGFLVSLLFAALAFAFGPLAIHLVYGRRFDGAALPLRLLLPGIVVFASAGTFASYFIFQAGKPAIVTWINAGMIALQTGACFAVVPRYGMAGAALASTVTYLAGAIANTWLFTRASGLPPGDLWAPKRSDLQRLLEIRRHLTPRRRAAAGSEIAERRDIVVTGAAGGVAKLLRPLLRERYSVRLSDRARVGNLRASESFTRANIESVGAMRKLFRGARAVVHLAAISKEAPFERIAQTNISGLHSVLEAARLEGVSRVVFASTGHVTGFYPRTTLVDEAAPMRPDTLYAVSKGLGELLGRYYADKYGLEIVCIRIGHVSETPEHDIDRHIWISPRDLAALVVRAIEHQPVHCETVYGVSDNARRFWSLERGRALGFEPVDGVAENAPIGQTTTDVVAGGVQGESFAARGFSGSLSRILGTP